MTFMHKLIADTSGTSAVEYGLICSLMVIGLVVGVQELGASVVNSFSGTHSAMQTPTLVDQISLPSTIGRLSREPR
jgi:Flp pilus assembly pilin Flp